jgi:peptidoglycan/xylan/chitin deacetylase (PgdA/CDA1 family)
MNVRSCRRQFLGEVRLVPLRTIPAGAEIARSVNSPPLTRFRAPFGEPYQNGDPLDQMVVAPTVARYAVEINWNFDSGDSNGTVWDAAALFANVKKTIQTPGKGAWGIVLAHSVYPWTTQMLPMLIPYLRQSGFKLATVEDVLCWRFGKHSWEIIPNKVPN